MKKLTRIVSVLLSALMVASMFTALNFTAFAADSKLTIRANSNIFPTQTQEFNADTNQITVTWWMQVSDANMVNTQCVITYDSSKLAVDMTDGVNSTIQDGKRVDRILRVTDGVGTVTNYAPQQTYLDLHENNPSGKFLDGESDNDASIKVNSVNLEGRELTESNGKVPFVSVTFNPKDGAQGVTNVNLYVEIMQIRGESEEEEHYFIARSEIADNKVSYMPETPSAVYAGTFDDYSVQAGDVFTVAGTANFLGTAWAPAPDEYVMTKGSDGNYTITVKNVKAIDGAVYQVKVVQFVDGDTENPIWHGVPGTGNNVDFGLKSDCDVTVTYNPSTGEIKVTGTGVTDPSYKIDYVAVVGNVNNAVICFVRSCKAREFFRMCIPVKISTVNNCTTHCHCMSIHIFCCRMSYDVCSPFKRTTIDWCCKCIVDDQWNPMLVCKICHLFNIENNQCRVCNGFTNHTFCIILKCLFNFFFRCIRINKSTVNTHFFDCCCKQVKCSPINFRRTNDMVSCLTDICNCIEICSLS